MNGKVVFADFNLLSMVLVAIALLGFGGLILGLGLDEGFGLILERDFTLEEVLFPAIISSLFSGDESPKFREAN